MLFMDNTAINLFKGTIETLSQSLNLRARKHEAILNNVANADTPNYKPFKMDVEKALQAAPPTQSSRLRRTNDKHLAGRQTSADPSVDIEAANDNPLLFRGDKNGVDVDAEMTALAKNSLLYKASTQMVSAKISGLKKAITGGKQ
jgi:flagellar basal-body rod protein FlgB